MRLRPQRAGFVAVLAAVAMTALLGMSALAVDGAFLMQLKTQLQNVADAAALAAASGLTADLTTAQARAQQYADANPVLGERLDLSRQASDALAFGQWNFDTRTFQTEAGLPNAVRLTVRMDSTSAPPMPRLFFAPVIGFRTHGVEATATASLGNRNIVLVLDRSGSMNDDNADPEEPLTQTKAAAQEFLRRVKNSPVSGDRVGLVYYNDEARLIHELTEAFEDVSGTAGIADPAINASGFTNIAAALCTAREAIREGADSRGIKVIVLLSDGKTNSRVNPTTCARSGAPGIDQGHERESTNRSRQQAAQEAVKIRQDGIILYTISLGNDTDEPLMIGMAQDSGEHFHAPAASDLQAVFEQISARIPVVLVE